MENNYQLSRIHNYVNGLMSQAEMYELEREAADDPFLQDAIDGYSLQQGINVKQLSLLQQRLAIRVEDADAAKSKRFYSWQRLAIGMVAGVMFVTVCTLLLMRYLPQRTVSELNEVVVSEHLYDFSISADQLNTALPIGGWEDFYKQLNSSYSNVATYQGDIRVDFQLTKEGEVKDLRLSNDKGHLEDEELENIIRHKVKWKGEKGDFTLNINGLDL